MRDSTADPLSLTSPCLMASGSPAATRIICSTRSMSVTRSVIPAQRRTRQYQRKHIPTAWPRGELLNASMATVALGGQAAVTPIAGLVVDQQGEPSMAQCRGFGDALISPT